MINFKRFPKITESHSTLGATTIKEEANNLLSQEDIPSNMLPPTEIIRDILIKPPEERNAIELQRLSSLIKEIKFFQERDIRDSDLIQICECLRLEDFNMGDVVFEHKSLGNKFYIIIEGKVAVLLPRPDNVSTVTSPPMSPPINLLSQESNPGLGIVAPEKMESEVALQKLERAKSRCASRQQDRAVSRAGSLTGPRTESRASSRNEHRQDQALTQGVKLAASPQPQATLQTPPDLYHSKKQSMQSIRSSFHPSHIISSAVLKRRFPEFMEVGDLEVGKSFGELALIKNKPRAATIVCRQVCSFAVMDRNDYKKVLGKLEQKRMNRLTEFLYSLPFFLNWTRGSIQKFQYFLQHKEYTRNQTVFKENEPSSHVYIVLNGEFEISITHTFSAPKSLDCRSLLTQKFSGGTFNKSVLINQNFFLSGGENPFSDTIKRTKKIRLIMLGRGNLLGEDDALSHRKRRHYSVRCISNRGELMQMKSDDFYKKVRSSDQALKVIQMNLETKQNNIQKVLSRFVYYSQGTSLPETPHHSRNQRSLEEGFVKMMRKQMRKQTIEEAKRQRTAIPLNKTFDDDRPSHIQTIIDSAKRELTLPSMQFEKESSISLSTKKLDTSDSPRPLNLYNLKFNVNPLGNRLSGGQKVYLSQAFTIDPKRGRKSSKKLRSPGPEVLSNERVRLRS